METFSSASASPRAKDFANRLDSSVDLESCKHVCNNSLKTDAETDAGKTKGNGSRACGAGAGAGVEAGAVLYLLCCWLRGRNYLFSKQRATNHVNYQCLNKVPLRQCEQNQCTSPNRERLKHTHTHTHTQKQRDLQGLFCPVDFFALWQTS